MFGPGQRAFSMPTSSVLAGERRRHTDKVCHGERLGLPPITRTCLHRVFCVSRLCESVPELLCMRALEAEMPFRRRPEGRWQPVVATALAPALPQRAGWNRRHPTPNVKNKDEQHAANKFRLQHGDDTEVAHDDGIEDNRMSAPLYSRPTDTRHCNDLFRCARLEAQAGRNGLRLWPRHPISLLRIFLRCMWRCRRIVLDEHGRCDHGRCDPTCIGARECSPTPR